MQREQNYSGKGGTTNPTLKNGEKTVQTVKTPDQSNSSSSVSPSNATAVTPLTIQVPDFFASQCVSEERANALRTLIKDTCEAAFKTERVAGFPDYTDYLNEFEDALNQIVTRTLVSHEASQKEPEVVEPDPDPTAGMRPHEKEEYLKYTLPPNVFRLSDPDERESITITSNGSFFHTISGREFLGEAINHLASWYSAYGALDEDAKQSMPIDPIRSIAFFGEIVQFMTDMIQEVAYKEFNKGASSKTRAYEKVLDAFFSAHTEEKIALVKDHTADLKKALAEIERLRSLCETAQPESEAPRTEESQLEQ